MHSRAVRSCTHWAALELCSLRGQKCRVMEEIHLCLNPANYYPKTPIIERIQNRLLLPNSSEKITEQIVTHLWRGNQTCQRCNSCNGVASSHLVPSAMVFWSIMNQFEPFSSLVNRGSTKTLQFWAAATLFVCHSISFTEIQTQSISHVSVAFSTTVLCFQTVS